MSVSYRPGTLHDSYTVFRVFEQTVSNLSYQLGYSAAPPEDDPERSAAAWQERRPLFEHLARTAHQFWLALSGDEVIGYARSILHGGLLDLTEFFVLPGRQSAGVGRELLSRAFTSQPSPHRSIIATVDMRALARYLKSGVYARFPIYNFSRQPRPGLPASDLEVRPLAPSPHDLDLLNGLDQRLLGHIRQLDHTFWLSYKQGCLFYRRGELLGYGYIHKEGGPFLLADTAAYPAALSFAENRAASLTDRFYLEVPLINQSAVDWLLLSGYQMSPFFAFFMSDSPWGSFDSYVFANPPFTV
jgi:GNAT superfamily N-acetyltransferase